MTLQFSNPAWLWLLALAPVTAWLGWRWLRGMTAVRRASAVVARAVLIALVTGMLAGATSVRSTDRLAVIAVVDVSGSVRDFFGVQGGEQGRGGSALERVREFLKTATADRGPDDLFGLVVFDGTSLAVASPTRVDVLDRPLDAAPTTEGTDIDAAMRLAAAMLPPDANGRIVLVSDGNQTRGDALAAARSLAAGRGAPPSVDVVPLRYRVRSEVVVEAVETPTQAPAGSTVTARVRLRATAPAKGRLELMLGDEPVDLSPGVEGTGLALTLAAGERTVSVPVTLGPGRVHEFSAIFVPDNGAEGGVGSGGSGAGDTVAVNNRAESYTFSPGRGSVLLVDGVSRTDEAGGAVLAQTLRAAGMEVSVVAPEGIPGDLLRLEAYDLVMLANVPAEAVATGTQEALAAYVSQLGGGVVMIGGPDSLGAGGWKGTPVEPLLPVRLDLPEQMIVPPAAIIIVIDNSGSMNRSVMGSSRTQQEIANQGAALAIETLDKGDELGVTAFNSSYRRIIPLRTLEDPRAAADLVRGIQPDGGTNIPPPVADAFEQMKASRAAVRHIILLTDGISAEGRGRLPDLAREIAAEGIKLSTIAVGDAADTGTLKEMAELGGGEYYRVNDPNTLPRVFVRAVRVVRTPLIREGRFDPVVLGTASPVMAGVQSPPALTGLVLTQAREDATVTYTMMAPTGEPLLGYWNAGLGRVGVFTSDAHKWAAEWVAWPGYSRLWTQFARQIARPPSERGTELALSVEGDALRIRLDAADDAGTPLDLLEVVGKVYGPTGAPADIRLSQTAPGVYEASVPAAQGGGYVVTLTPRRGTKTLAPVVGGITRPPGEEYRRLESDDALLRQIAGATGGRVLDLAAPTPGVLFDREGLKPGSVRTPLWRGLMLWTLVVLLLDVGTRRVAWDRFIGSEYGTGLRQRAREAVRGRGRQAEGTLRSLRGRREQSTAAAPAAAEKALGTDAALEIIREQARRRAEARARAAAGGPKEAAVRDEGPRAKPVSGTEGEGAGEQPSGLRQAKERARRRMEGREEDGS